jgi:hypothetical protein
MQADRWKQVEELFEAALAQPLEKRAAFLEQVCTDDPQLRGEVQSLLNLVPSAASFLEGAPISSMHEHSLVLTRGRAVASGLVQRKSSSKTYHPSSNCVAGEVMSIFRYGTSGRSRG